MNFYGKAILREPRSVKKQIPISSVSKLVSKWNEKTLAEHKKAEKIDVTDLLLREFKLTDKQVKVIEDMKTKPPLPLDKAKELLRKGEL